MVLFKYDGFPQGLYHNGVSHRLVDGDATRR